MECVTLLQGVLFSGGVCRLSITRAFKPVDWPALGLLTLYNYSIVLFTRSRTLILVKVRAFLSLGLNRKLSTEELFIMSAIAKLGQRNKQLSPFPSISILISNTNILNKKNFYGR